MAVESYTPPLLNGAILDLRECLTGSGPAQLDVRAHAIPLVASFNALLTRLAVAFGCSVLLSPTRRTSCDRR